MAQFMDWHIYKLLIKGILTERMNEPANKLGGGGGNERPANLWMHTFQDWRDYSFLINAFESTKLRKEKKGKRPARKSNIFSKIWIYQQWVDRQKRTKQRQVEASRVVQGMFMKKKKTINNLSHQN